MPAQNLLQSLKCCRCMLFSASTTSFRRHQQFNYSSKTPSDYPLSVNSSKRVENAQADYSKDATCGKDQSVPQVKLTIVFSKENLQKEIDAQVGMSVFEAIMEHDSTLLPDTCDGQLCCSTCHCLVQEKDMHYFSPLNLDEEDLLDEFPNVKLNSRLLYSAACKEPSLNFFESLSQLIYSNLCTKTVNQVLFFQNAPLILDPPPPPICSLPNENTQEV